MLQIKNISEFENALKNDKLILIEFRTKWCSTCKSMEPIIEKVDKQIEDKAKIYVIDATEPESISIAQKQDVMGVPTFIFYKNGKELSRYSGILSENKIIELININL